MTNVTVWIALWMAQWFTVNTDWVCYCMPDKQRQGEYICWCELEMKKGAKP